MTELENKLEKLIQWGCSLNDFPRKWSEILVIEDPLFKFRAEEWEVPRTSLNSITDYSSRFNKLLNSGYSWINLNIGGLYQGKLIIFIEYPREPSGYPKGKTSINYSGPEGNIWDLNSKLSITS